MSILRTGRVKRVPFGKGFAISHRFQPIWSNIANSCNRIDAILPVGLRSRATGATKPKIPGSPSTPVVQECNPTGASLTVSRKPLEQKRLNFSKRDPFLLHRVSFPHCDCTLVYWSVLADRIEIDGHSKGSTGLILTPVTPPDGARFVIKNHHMRP